MIRASAFASNIATAPYFRTADRCISGRKPYNAGMEIDLYQLPIPDWGVLCPQCSYPLVGLPAHRCPECGLKFDMGEVVQSWHRLRPPRFTGQEDPFPDFGMDCTRCRRPLAGARGFACPHCDTRFDPESRRPRRDWHPINDDLYGGVSAATLAPILAAEKVPYMFAENNVIRDVFGVTNVTDARLLIPNEFYFDTLWLIQRSVVELRSRRGKAGASWRCPRCSEKVPGHFEVCWNCQAPRGE